MIQISALGFHTQQALAELCDEALNTVISTHIASIICLPSAGAWSLQQIIAKTVATVGPVTTSWGDK